MARTSAIKHSLAGIVTEFGGAMEQLISVICIYIEFFFVEDATHTHIK